MSKDPTPLKSTSQAAATETARPDEDRKVRVPTLAVYGILTLALFYTLYFASSLFVPIAIAIMLNVIFSPLARSLSKRRIPSAISAAFIVLFLIGSIGFSTILLSNPVSDWIDRLPTVAWQIKSKIGDLMEPVESVRQITTQVDDIAKTATSDGSNKADSTVEIKGPSLSDQLFESMQTIVLQLGVVAALLFFLLASGDLFKERFIAMVPGLRGKKQVLTIMQSIERDASTYLLTMTGINFVLGFAIGVALWLLGLPNAVLWGFMAMILNFVPFVGAIVGAGIIFMVALISQDTLTITLAAPLTYIGLSILEGQFITPGVLGKKLTISPVIIFVFVLFWGWLWGVPGAVMAVPILVILRAFCENIDSLHLVSLFLRGKTPKAA